MVRCELEISCSKITLSLLYDFFCSCIFSPSTVYTHLSFFCHGYLNGKVSSVTREGGWVPRITLGILHRFTGALSAHMQGTLIALDAPVKTKSCITLLFSLVTMTFSLLSFVLFCCQPLQILASPLPQTHQLDLSGNLSQPSLVMSLLQECRFGFNSQPF